MTNTPYTGNEPYTDAELEEARYEMWLASDGPAKLTLEHRELALRSTADDLEMNGWLVIQNRMVRSPSGDIMVNELIIRRGDDVRLVRWHAFNKGWMEKHTCGGWVIFNPIK